MHTLLMAIFLTHVVSVVAYELKAKEGFSKKEKLQRMVDTLSVMICAGLVAFAPYEPEFSAVFGVVALGSMTWLVRGSTYLSRLPRLNAWVCVVRPVTLISLLVLWPFINGVSLFTGLVLPFSTSGLKDIGISYFAALSVALIFQLIRWKRTEAQAKPVVEEQSLPTQNAA